MILSTNQELSDASDEYPRLLKCELPLSFFQKNFANIELICKNDAEVWKA